MFSFALFLHMGALAPVLDWKLGANFSELIHFFHLGLLGCVENRISLISALLCSAGYLALELLEDSSISASHLTKVSQMETIMCVFLCRFWALDLDRQASVLSKPPRPLSRHQVPVCVSQDQLLLAMSPTVAKSSPLLSLFSPTQYLFL